MLAGWFARQQDKSRVWLCMFPHTLKDETNSPMVSIWAVISLGIWEPIASTNGY